MRHVKKAAVFALGIVASSLIVLACAAFLAWVAHAAGPWVALTMTMLLIFVVAFSAQLYFHE